MCYPVGDEYIRFHRTFKLLADRLAKIGFFVLRFDYYGCGDSSGNFEQGRIKQWLQDTELAIDEIKNKFGVMKVSLIGLRLGGTLSVITGTEKGNIDNMVLWDPVVFGKDYLSEMAALQKKMLSYAHVQSKSCSIDKHFTENLGFPLTDILLADIKNIDLLTIPKKPANNILLISSNKKTDQLQLSKYLKSLNINVENKSLISPQLWVWEEAIGKIRVPFNIIQLIVTWISEVYK
jgi:pimeloyl-ACP methyl ester carboxylesterase